MLLLVSPVLDVTQVLPPSELFRIPPLPVPA